ncbi:helix-turn-helix domain-containing protein [Lentzea sp. NPDC005914]|uniref:helix-turn-helix domain-containing protein n=1 Tax=Lentzea sp. NPDC005914 TaxID=3154572 RepID=UPI0033C833DF
MNAGAIALIAPACHRPVVRHATSTRAIVVLMSGQGRTVRDITSMMQVSDDYVRDVVHAFNERGFGALDPKMGRLSYDAHAVQIRSALATKLPPMTLAMRSSR